MLNRNKIRVLGFDCCNTVFSIAGVPREELSDYIEQVRRPNWAPLVLPAEWLDLDAHEDCAEGIARIQAGGFKCVTLSNWPADLLANLSAQNGIAWDAIIPMERRRVYKPNPVAYENVCAVMNTAEPGVLMVTANESAPDIPTAIELGMQAILIDREHKHGPEVPKTIIELAEMLGC